jgi:LysR family transcriptional activator of mexEF-oprN operon
MRLVVIPVQFRTVVEAFASARVDLAVTVADELPAGTERRALLHAGFVCLFDPRHARPGRPPSLDRYLAHEHVVVSYNGDLRGVVEDMLGVERRVRVSLPTFESVGVVVDGSSLLATVPEMVAREILSLRPHLRTAPLPREVVLGGAPMELLWRSAVDDDAAVRFVRDLVVRLAERASRPARKVRRA